MRIAVVGAGASGALAAIHLAHAGAAEVTLVDTRPVGRGIAYGTTDPAHLMNTPIGRVSAFPDDPDHLLRWVRRTRPARAGEFPPRAEFGRYLAETLAEAPGVVREVPGQAVAVHADRGFRLSLAGGDTVFADAVVLAMGNSVQTATPSCLAGLAGDSRYVADPWHGLGAVPPGSRVLLVGTGLTMADVAGSLAADPSVRLHAVSRRGLLPHAHQAVAPQDWAVAEILRADSLTGLVRAVRQAADDGWRGLLDAVRPHSQEVWGRLPAADRVRFFQRFGRYWDVHRHRLPPEVAARIEGLTASGRLRVHRGELGSVRARRGGLVATVAGEQLVVDRVVNCAGYGRDLWASDDPLLRQLFDSGLARPNEFGTGLAADEHGRVLGAASGGLVTLGPLRRGSVFETTAIPEIRAQAVALAEGLLLLPDHL